MSNVYLATRWREPVAGFTTKRRIVRWARRVDDPLDYTYWRMRGELCTCITAEVLRLLGRPSPAHRWFPGWGWCDPMLAHHFEELGLDFPTDVTRPGDDGRVWAR